MKGLTVKAVEAIEQMVGTKFDEIGMEFIGLVPKISRTKRIVFSTARNSLTSLFLQALGSRNPSKSEEEMLKVLLRIANNYVEGLKERTQARVVQNINSYVMDQNSKREPIKKNKISKIYNDEMDKAKKHFKLIANSESNKVTNVGTAMQIAKVGESNGEDDPTVFFVVTIDDVTGPEEFVLHLLPDRKTPRVWKLSEIGNEYHKKGDHNPKFAGLHPNCRCKLTYLAKGYGFDKNGKVTYIGKDHNELIWQRERHGLPREEDIKKAIQRNGKWHIEDGDNHGDDHPENSSKPYHEHQVVHQAQNGQKYWNPKYHRFAGKTLTQDQMDTVHRGLWKDWAKQNNLSGDLRNSLVSLNKFVITDPDRGMRVSGTSGHEDKNHSEMRQRHLLHLFSGKEGYGFEEVKHPETGAHMGVRIKVPRHHKDGNLGETSWLWDGKSLKTEHNRIFHGKKWY